MRRPSSKSCLFITVMLMATLMANGMMLQVTNMQANTKNLKNDPLAQSEQIKGPKCESEINKEGRYTNIGSNAVANQNYTFEGTDFAGNMMVTSKYVFFGQYNQNPTIKRLDLSTMTLETFQYDRPKYWSGAYGIQSIDMKNGDLAFGAEYYVFIVDISTMKIKQTLVQVMENEQINQALSYFNPARNQSKFIFGRGEYMSSYTRQQNGSYIQKQILKSQDKMFLTSTENAVTVQLYECSASFWSNLNTIVDTSFDMKFHLYLQEFVALADSQNLFMTVDYDEYYNYHFYSLDEDYDISLKSTLFITKDTLRKGAFTSDGKSVFVSMYNSNNQFHVAKVDVEANNYTFIADGEGKTDNQIDFQLFATQHNRFVTLSVRGKEYFLQLRTLNDSAIIHELPLRFNFTVLESKLIGTAAWGFIFGVAVRTRPYADDLQNDSSLYIYKVEGDKIIVLNLPSVAVGFVIVQACSTYFISGKERFKSFRIFHYSNMTLAKETSTPKVFLAKAVIVQKDTLVLGDLETFIVYDLKNSLEQKGIINRVFDILKSSIIMVLQQRGVIYHSRNWYPPPGTRVRAIYNLTNPSITFSLKINSEFLCHSLTYVQSPNQPTSDYYFYFEREPEQNPRLVRYSECTKTKEIYRFDSFKDIDMEARICVSSDKRTVFLIICAKKSRGSRFLVEGRSVASPQKVIYSEFFDVEGIDYFSACFDLYADLINDMLLIKAPNALYVKFLNQADKFENDKESKKGVEVVVSEY